MLNILGTDTNVAHHMYTSFPRLITVELVNVNLEHLQYSSSVAGVCIMTKFEVTVLAY